MIPNNYVILLNAYISKNVYLLLFKIHLVLTYTPMANITISIIIRRLVAFIICNIKMLTNYVSTLLLRRYCSSLATYTYIMMIQKQLRIQMQISICTVFVLYVDCILHFHSCFPVIVYKEFSQLRLALSLGHLPSLFIKVPK